MALACDVFTTTIVSGFDASTPQLSLTPSALPVLGTKRMFFRWPVSSTKPWVMVARMHSA